jgi:hypothetical protein
MLLCGGGERGERPSAGQCILARWPTNLVNVRWHEEIHRLDKVACLALPWATRQAHCGRTQQSTGPLTGMKATLTKTARACLARWPARFNTSSSYSHTPPRVTRSCCSVTLCTLRDLGPACVVRLHLLISRHAFQTSKLYLMVRIPYRTEASWLRQAQSIYI